jgi:hypothetical protein
MIFSSKEKQTAGSQSYNQLLNTLMNRLTDKHFSFKCPMNWDSMQATDNGRFCGKCRKEVFDLTNCSLDEVRELQQKHGSICGSIRVMGAAAVAISLSTAACQKENRKPDSVRTTGELPSPSQVAMPQEPRVMGDVCILPPLVEPEKKEAPKELPPEVMGVVCPVPPLEATPAPSKE